MSGFDTSRLLRDEKELFGTDLHYRRFLALFLAGTVIVISYISLFGKWGDLNYYFQCMDTLLDGNIPYKDYEYEFPPLSIPFLLLPRLLSLNVDMYHFWYAFFAFV